MLSASDSKAIAGINAILPHLIKITGTENRGVGKECYEAMVGQDMPADANNIGMSTTAHPESYTLSLQAGVSIKLNGRPIKRLKHFNYQGTNMRASRLEVVYADGAKELYGYPTIDTINAMMSILVFYSIKFNAFVEEDIAVDETGWAY